MKRFRKSLLIWLSLVVLMFTGCGGDTASETTATQNDTTLKVITEEADSSDASTEYANTEDEDASDSQSEDLQVTEDGTYTSKDEVALYIHTYGHLPSNFISKTKARKAGWNSKEGNLDDVLPGMSIGGSQYKNYDGTLPDAEGRTWTECDINYTGGYRSAERIIFSNDGLVYYTNDHYKTFEQLY